MTISLILMKVKIGMSRTPNTLDEVQPLGSEGGIQAETQPIYHTYTQQMPKYTHTHPRGSRPVSPQSWSTSVLAAKLDQDRASGETGKLYSWCLREGAHHLVSGGEWGGLSGRVFKNQEASQVKRDGQSR